jgi:hypothetical protein
MLFLCNKAIPIRGKKDRHVRREKSVTDQLAPVFFWYNRVVKKGKKRDKNENVSRMN